MYSAWKITVGENEDILIIYGKDVKVDEYKKEHLDNKDYGGGFEGRSFEEIISIVDGLKKNHPKAKVVAV